MLFGATGQCLTMVLLAVLGSINNSAARVVSAVLLFVFNSFFAVGWLGMTWLYVRFYSALSLISLHNSQSASRDCGASNARPGKRSFDGMYSGNGRDDYLIRLIGEQLDLEFLGRHDHWALVPKHPMENLHQWAVSPLRYLFFANTERSSLRIIQCYDHTCSILLFPR